MRLPRGRHGVHPDPNYSYNCRMYFMGGPWRPIGLQLHLHVHGFSASEALAAQTRARGASEEAKSGVQNPLFRGGISDPFAYSDIHITQTLKLCDKPENQRYTVQMENLHFTKSV